MKKKTTKYLTKYLVIMIAGMTVYVIMDSFVKLATPVIWGTLLITTAWFAYASEFGGKDE